MRNSIGNGRPITTTETISEKKPYFLVTQIIKRLGDYTLMFFDKRECSHPPELRMMVRDPDI